MNRSELPIPRPWGQAALDPYPPESGTVSFETNGAVGRQRPAGFATGSPSRVTENLRGTDRAKKTPPPKRGREPSENAALCQRAGPGEGSVAAFSTARSISSTVMSGVMLTRTTPVELPTSDTAVAEVASG